MDNAWIGGTGLLARCALPLGGTGALLGRIRLPEGCANLTFGGPKRNILFMTASQSIYALQVQAQGAAPG